MRGILDTTAGAGDRRPKLWPEQAHDRGRRREQIRGGGARRLQPGGSGVGSASAAVWHLVPSFGRHGVAGLP